MQQAEETAMALRQRFTERIAFRGKYFYAGFIPEEKQNEIKTRRSQVLISDVYDNAGN